MAIVTYAFLNDDGSTLASIDVLPWSWAGDGDALCKGRSGESEDGKDELHCVIEGDD